jgi:type III secretion protein V
MVAQIPALLGAMAAGLIVTRTTDEEHDRHLGDAIRKQVSAKPRVQLVAGAICLLLALVPGFPALVFVALGLASVTAGVLLVPAWRDRLATLVRPALKGARGASGMKPSSNNAPTVASTAPPTPRPAVPLLLEVPPALLAEDGAGRLTAELQALLEDFQLSLGLPLPRIAVHGVPVLAADTGVARWRLLAYEVPLAQGEQPPGDPHAGLAAAVRESLRRHAPMFIGIQETTQLLTRASADVPDVVKEVLRALPVQKVAEVLRRLVAEEVSIRNLRDILEALAEAAQREKDVQALTEMARIALRRQLNHRVAPNGELGALTLAPELEDMLRQAVRVSGGVAQLTLEPDMARRVAASIQALITRHAPGALVCAIDVRWHVRKLIEPECFDTPVLSLHELMPTLRLQPLGQVPMPGTVLLEAA